MTILISSRPAFFRDQTGSASGSVRLEISGGVSNEKYSLYE